MLSSTIPLFFLLFQLEQFPYDLNLTNSQPLFCTSCKSLYSLIIPIALSDLNFKHTHTSPVLDRRLQSSTGKSHWCNAHKTKICFSWLFTVIYNWTQTFVSFLTFWFSIICLVPFRSRFPHVDCANTESKSRTFDALCQVSNYSLSYN